MNWRLTLSISCFGIVALLTLYACSGTVPHPYQEVAEPTDIYICPTETVEDWVIETLWEEYPKYGYNPILPTNVMQGCDVIVQHDPAHKAAYALIMFFVYVGGHVQYFHETGKSVMTIALGDADIVRHEVVHTFGCGHISDANCREQIKRHRELLDRSGIETNMMDYF